MISDYPCPMLQKMLPMQENMHNHLANFLKATKISGIAHINALYRFRGADFCDFWFLAQK
jgi:hypothetical protein